MKGFFENFAKNIRSVVALSIVWMSFVFLFLLLHIVVPTENRDMINMSAGIVLAKLGDVTAYLFGSSKDKSDKEKAEIAQTSASNVGITTTKEAEKTE